MFRNIAVAMSGGVDSAVAALILLKKGFSVSGIYMKNWDALDEVGYCNGSGDAEDAKKVCEKLNIPFYEVNFVVEYWNHVFSDFIKDYQEGLTPNPDILCNKYIKFDKLFNYAINKLEVDALATGHYASNSFGQFLEYFEPNLKPKLLTSIDRRKDQTFFLSQIPSIALKRTMFPLASLKKKEVKEMARNYNLHNVADKKESQGICFIGPRKFKDFISEYIAPKKGYFIDVDNGRVVGEHNGIHQWTVGQKCRLGGLKQPYYVVEKTRTGEIVVASGHGHPALYNLFLTASNPHWIHSEPEDLATLQGLSCYLRFQHGKPLTGCHVTKLHSGLLDIILDEPLRALTPGQYTVFYKDNECLGSARIMSASNRLCKVVAEI